MIPLINRLNIDFDQDGNTTLSKEKLLLLLGSASMFADYHNLPDEFYMLIDQNGMDFYPFPKNDFQQWEADGSFEVGDSIYHVKLFKKISK